MSQITPIEGFRPITPWAFSGAYDPVRDIQIPAGSTVNVCKNGIWLFPIPEQPTFTLTFHTNMFPYVLAVIGPDINFEQTINQATFSLPVTQFNNYSYSARALWHDSISGFALMINNQEITLNFVENEIKDAILSGQELEENKLFVLDDSNSTLNGVNLHNTYLALESEPSEDEFIDIDENPYETVIIGNQEWTVRNADNTLGVYYNTIQPPNGQPGTQEPFLNAGRLFTAANAAQAISQESLGAGWRVPTFADYQQLVNYLYSQNPGYDSSTIGYFLKSTTMWPTNPGNDKYGFKGLPAGFGSYNTISNFYSFLNLFIYANFWATNAPTQNFPSGYAVFTLHNAGNYIGFLDKNPLELAAVRYVRDLPTS